VKKSLLITSISVLVLLLVVVGMLYLGRDTEFPYNHRYDLAEIAQDKASTVGDLGKITALVQHLPLPDDYFSLRGVGQHPLQGSYALMIRYDSSATNVFDFLDYRNKKGVQHRKEVCAMISAKNALVLFAMVADLQQVDFVYSGIIAKDVGLAYSFHRADFEAEYGSLKELGDNIDRLAEILAEACSVRSNPH
jgi:hypothetical protein